MRYQLIMNQAPLPALKAGQRKILLPFSLTKMSLPGEIHQEYELQGLIFYQ